MKKFIYNIVVFLFLTSIVYSQDIKYISSGMTGQKQDALQGLSYAYSFKKVFLSMEFNREFKDTGRKYKSIKAGFNIYHNYTNKRGYRTNSGLFFTLYIGYTFVDAYYDRMNAGLRLNYMFKNLPIGVYIDRDMVGTQGFGILIPLKALNKY